MDNANRRFRPTVYMPFLLAWTLSCLLLSASVQSGPFTGQVQATQQVPFADFTYSSNHFALRTQTSALNFDDEQGDSPALLPSYTALAAREFAQRNVNLPALPLDVRAVYRLAPRGPPVFLN